MTDHYELLGVESDATKDEIKAAYRAEIANADSAQRAELNRAWNVLSDPMQRSRYDATRVADDNGDDEIDDASPVVPRADGRTQSGDDQPSGPPERGQLGGSGGKVTEDDGRRRPPPPTVELGRPRSRAEDPQPAMLFILALLVTSGRAVRRCVAHREPVPGSRPTGSTRRRNRSTRPIRRRPRRTTPEHSGRQPKAAQKKNDSAAEADAKAAVRVRRRGQGRTRKTRP